MAININDKSILVLDKPFLKTEGIISNPIGVIFLSNRPIIVTSRLPHLIIKMKYVELMLNSSSEISGLSSCNEIELYIENSIDIFIRNETIYLRPDPDNPELALQADAFLQKTYNVPKVNIRFQNIMTGPIRDILKESGEVWRYNEYPLIESITIGTSLVYYYIFGSGRRVLAFQEFLKIRSLDASDIRECLIEFKDYSRSRNRFGLPEAEVFMAPAFGYDLIRQFDFCSMSDEKIRSCFDLIADEFSRAVIAPEFKTARLDDPEGRKLIIKNLLPYIDDVASDIIGLSAEFEFQVRWLIGGTIIDGSFVPDPEIKEARQLDENSRGLIDGIALSIMEEHVQNDSGIRYINAAKLVHSLSQSDARKGMEGRRDVYILVYRSAMDMGEKVKYIRIQKKDASYYLDRNHNWREAIQLSEKYSDYVLNRITACRALGMNIYPVSRHSFSETYRGKNKAFHGLMTRTYYYERDYFHGTATDKIPEDRWKDNTFAVKIFILLGKAAAANMIAGRVFREAVIFDDGDEIVSLSENEIVITDITASFGDCETDLEYFCEQYAIPIIKRLPLVCKADDCIEAYLSSFVSKFKSIQHYHSINIDAMRNLFKHQQDDFQLLWGKALRRLEMSNPVALAEKIKGSIYIKHEAVRV